MYILNFNSGTYVKVSTKTLHDEWDAYVNKACAEFDEHCALRDEAAGLHFPSPPSLDEE